MKADKRQFDEVLRRMIQKNPQKTSQIKNPRRRRNPETDPRYLPVVDFNRTIEITPEVAEDIEAAKRMDREFRKKKHSQK